MQDTAKLVASIYGQEIKPCPVLAALRKEVAIIKARRSWWQKLVELF